MLAMLAAGAALTLVVMSLAVPREVEARRRARLRAAQGYQSRPGWCRACQARTEQRRVDAEVPRLGGRNLLIAVADLAALVLEPWLCVRCGRARRF